MTSLRSSDQDNQNEVQHVDFGHETPVALVLVSCDAEGIVKGTIAFVKSI